MGPSYEYVNGPLLTVHQLKAGLMKAGNGRKNSPSARKHADPFSFLLPSLPLNFKISTRNQSPLMRTLYMPAVPGFFFFFFKELISKGGFFVKTPANPKKPGAFIRPSAETQSLP